VLSTKFEKIDEKVLKLYIVTPKTTCQPRPFQQFSENIIARGCRIQLKTKNTIRGDKRKNVLKLCNVAPFEVIKYIPSIGARL
jgi:hypothetical protein